MLHLTTWTFTTSALIMIDSNHNRETAVCLGNYQRPGAEAALVAPSAFYRSKVLNVSHSINPMIGASSSLFSIMSQCQQLPRKINLSKLQQELIHEIYSFESTIQSNQNYLERTILAARFALCSFVDETIQRALGEEQEQWQSLLLLEKFHSQTDGGQQFYDLLERAMADPAGYIDLLELFYMCLSLGYQGKFANSPQGFLIRENIINRVYQTIHEQRGEFSRSVMVGTEQAPPTVTPKRIKSKGVLIVSLFAMVTISALVANEFYSVQESNQSIQQAMSQLLNAKFENSNFQSVPQPR